MDMYETFCHDLCQGNFVTYITDAINHPWEQAEICFKCVEDYIEYCVNDYRKQLSQVLEEYVNKCKDDLFYTPTSSSYLASVISH